MSSISQQTVLRISNVGIREELLSNFDKNAVFRLDRRALLYQIEEVLQKEETCSEDEVNATDILLTIDVQTLDEYTKNITKLCLLKISGKDLVTRRAFWNHLVALLFMRQLSQKYSVQGDHIDLLDEEELYFTEKSFEDYLSVESELVSREDVFKAIENLNLPKPIRVHIILKTETQGLDDEISYYLQTEYPFITMVYSESGNVGNITTWDENGHFTVDTRQYIYFDRGELSEDTYPKRAKRKISTCKKNKDT